MKRTDVQKIAPLGDATGRDHLLHVIDAVNALIDRTSRLHETEAELDEVRDGLESVEEGIQRLSKAHKARDERLATLERNLATLEIAAQGLARIHSAVPDKPAEPRSWLDPVVLQDWLRNTIRNAIVPGYCDAHELDRVARSVAAATLNLVAGREVAARTAAPPDPARTARHCG